MQLIMNDAKLQTIEQVKQFLEATEVLEFKGLSTEEKYQWIKDVLIRFEYHHLRRNKKGVIRRYLERVTGYSRAQVSRLIRRYKQTGHLEKTEYRRHRFPRKYTPHQKLNCWPEQMNYTSG